MIYFFTPGVLRKLLITSVLSGLAILVPLITTAENKTSSSMLKAIYTYKLANFIQWPASKLSNKTTAIRLCIIGNSPFSKSNFRHFKDKIIKQRPLTISTYPSTIISRNELQHCHIAFLGHSKKIQTAAFLKKLASHSVLTVSDTKNFSASGGMITLLSNNDKVTFRVNLEKLEQAQLRMSSKILDFSEIVQTRAGQ